MHALANAFLIAFGADGALSTAELALRAATGSAALAVPRETLALALLALAPVVVVALAVTRLPIGVLLPPALAALWLGLWALPLPLWLSGTRLDAAAISVQLGVATWAFARLRRTTGRWTLAPAAGAGFSRARALAFAAGTAVGLPIAVIVFGALGLAVGLERVTGGYLSVDAGGINAAERVYRRGPDEVQLVGMMHVGEASAYDALFASFASDSTLVLEEGVSDVEGRLSQPLSYLSMASALGLDSQQSVSAYFAPDPLDDDGADAWPQVRNADLDVSDFTPTTVAFLERAAEIWSQPSLREAVESASRVPVTESELRTLEDDIIGKRNDALLRALEESLGSYDRIVVPWGALHLPGIARRLEALGFEPGPRREIRLVSWATLAGGAR